ncbi:hypothetical protein LTR37_007738 [Vermiconidia calcicola]|uniref:Uncharacterized protein n=1 Tax=Vermiconidia calcicola TaxID=1690605 RepID=A0ACC3NCQ0_9PEZI|nr:hypothetical protein LTR37_007738 [Vermiconidia calcicola]
MCGRYALSLRPSQVRQRLADQNMPADEAPPEDDSQLRQSYNFAPGYHGLIYRAATNDRGTDATPYEHNNDQTDESSSGPSPKKAKLSHPPSSSQVDGLATRETKYKLQSAKWGLIPFWTKRSPDYGSMLRTINCRDDSLIENRGMWNTMKQRKRCIVLAEGFYEWLKKNGGKEKVPHFVKRKDGGLMCFAGLWDCVQYEDVPQEAVEKLYTYTVITTDSNKALKFLHDRMPVILEPGSEEMKRWLDPSNVGWNKELQSMLKPFAGELECYPVDKAVGKVGNNSPSFVVPVDSKENKKNIANFFGTQREKAGEVKVKNYEAGAEQKVEGEHRETTKEVEDPESNAPLPKPRETSEDDLSQAIKQDTNDLDDGAMLQAEDDSIEDGIKHETDALDDKAMLQAEDEATERGIKREADSLKDEDLLEAEKSPPQKVWNSPSKSTPGKTRSATSNSNVHKTPTKAGEGNKKITAFFGGK